MKVADNKMVSLRYSIKNGQGHVMVDIMNDGPFRYVCGSGGILPALEQNIRGMEQGAKKSFTLLKAEQPGLFEDLYIDVVIDDVSNDIPEKAAASVNNCDGGDCCC
ncbi:MAG: FKBP-type peptidyl-prolyl cis-trans isomerase [Bacteroidetes bacterium]|nr:FKBP-type peptidyl-prolyl cis-trans isomerase [Bacteroidota bacterium]